MFANCVFACRVFIMQGAGLMLAVIIRCIPERWVKRPQWLQERKGMKKEEREMMRTMSTVQRAGSTGGGSAAGHVQSSAARVSFVMAERAAEQRRAVSKARMAVLLKMVAQGVAPLEPRPAQHPMRGLRAARLTWGRGSQLGGMPSSAVQARLPIHTLLKLTSANAKPSSCPAAVCGCFVTSAPPSSASAHRPLRAAGAANRTRGGGRAAGTRATRGRPVARPPA